jgi:uroporphyrinogen-III synthase
MRVLVTRPKKEAQQWVHALTDAGYEALSFPLIGVLPAPDAQAVVAAWGRLATFDAVMFVSGNAVDHFFALKPPLALEFTDGSATNIRAFVTGPGSLSALKRAQVDARCMTCQIANRTVRFRGPVGRCGSTSAAGLSGFDCARRWQRPGV